MDKQILILAGPNGAGKTTFAREYLVREGACPSFVNADLIAAGLSPFDPARVALRSGRLMLELIAEHVGQGKKLRIRDDARRSKLRSRDRSSGVGRAIGFR